VGEILREGFSLEEPEAGTAGYGKIMNREVKIAKEGDAWTPRRLLYNSKAAAICHSNAGGEEEREAGSSGIN